MALTDSGRVEAFSDGVLAIAITLLVLDLRVPARDDLHGASLASALSHQWPAYAAYLVSFLTIGIMWVNHHAMFTQVRQVDRPVLFANLALLLAVSFLPFPTHLLAEYLTADGRDAHTAAAVYSATMLAVGLAFSTLWLAITRTSGLLHAHLDRVAGRAALRRFGVGSVAYAGTVALSFVNAYATLAVHGALALYYCFDQLATTGRAPVPEPGTE